MRAILGAAVMLFAPLAFAAQYLPPKSQISLSSDLVINAEKWEFKFVDRELNWKCYLNLRRQKRDVVVPAGTAFTVSKSKHESNSGFQDVGCVWNDSSGWRCTEEAYSWNEAAIEIKFAKNDYFKSIECSSYAGSYNKDLFSRYKERLSYEELEFLLSHIVYISVDKAPAR